MPPLPEQNKFDKRAIMLRFLFQRVRGVAKTRFELTFADATETPQLWQTLRQGISDVYTIEDHLTTLTDIYRMLKAKKLLEESNGHQRAVR